MIRLLDIYNILTIGQKIRIREKMVDSFSDPIYQGMSDLMPIELIECRVVWMFSTLDNPNVLDIIIEREG